MKKVTYQSVFFKVIYAFALAISSTSITSVQVIVQVHGKMSDSCLHSLRASILLSLSLQSFKRPGLISSFLFDLDRRSLQPYSLFDPYSTHISSLSYGKEDLTSAISLSRLSLIFSKRYSLHGNRWHRLDSID